MSALRVRELSPRGLGGVAVIEAAGPGALQRVLDLAPGAPVPPLGRPVLVRLGRGGEVLDEALVLAHSPERVEVHVHGSPPLVARVLAELGGRTSPTPATLEEQAWELLASAPCEAAARILLDQAQGALRRELEAATSDADPAARLRALAERGRVARHALEPATLALAGPVNAGKSTLFNLLLGAARVVVSDQAGTTRDAIRERVLLGRWPVDLVDAAGLRPLEGEERLERAGQALARELVRGADLVLWLDPLDRPAAPPADARGSLVRLRSRADLVAPKPGEPAISALRAGAEAVRTVGELHRRAFDLPEDPWRPGQGVPFTAGQREAVARAASLRGDALLEALAALLVEGDRAID